MGVLGLIAGGGDLPIELASSLTGAGEPIFIIRLTGMADQALARWPGADVDLMHFGAIFRTLHEAGCDRVCMIGRVDRPDYAAVTLDDTARAALPDLIAAGRQGDDALLRQVVLEYEKAGFRVIGAQEVTDGLTLAAGPLGAISPTVEHRQDIDRAMGVAREIGRLDIGQGAVVAHGLVLAVEAQEGTDGMLRRVADLPATVRGAPGAPFGVLAKVPKPIQERRVDLPTIGLATVQAAHRAGLAGIAGEAGAMIVLERAAVIAEADRLGLFIIGVEP